MKRKPRPKQPTNTSLDDLARMVADGFDQANKRFDLLDLRLNDFSRRLDSLERKVDKIQFSILEEYGKRIRTLESQIARLSR